MWPCSFLFKAFHGSHYAWPKALTPLWDSFTKSLKLSVSCSFKWRREKSYRLQTSRIPYCRRRGTQSDPGPPSSSDYETDALPPALRRQISLTFPLLTTPVCSSWRCQAWSYLRAFALLIPSTWTALPPGSSQGFSQRSPSQWFSPPSIWNHNSSLHPPSHAWNMLLCFICSISFITTYFIVCLSSFPIRL